MATLILQILLSLLGLAATVFVWWTKYDADKKKKVSDEDKKIQDCANADDVISELDRLRNEPPANR